MIDARFPLSIGLARGLHRRKGQSTAGDRGERRKKGRKRRREKETGGVSASPSDLLRSVDALPTFPHLLCSPLSPVTAPLGQTLFSKAQAGAGSPVGKDHAGKSRGSRAHDPLPSDEMKGYERRWSYVCVSVSVCVCVCMSVCVCVCARACVCGAMNEKEGGLRWRFSLSRPSPSSSPPSPSLSFTRTHTQTHKHAHIKAHTRTHTHTHTNLHPHPHTHANTVSPPLPKVTTRRQQQQQQSAPAPHTPMEVDPLQGWLRSVPVPSPYTRRLGRERRGREQGRAQETVPQRVAQCAPSAPATSPPRRPRRLALPPVKRGACAAPRLWRCGAEEEEERGGDTPSSLCMHTAPVPRLKNLSLSLTHAHAHAHVRTHKHARAHARTHTHTLSLVLSCSLSLLSSPLLSFLSLPPSLLSLSLFPPLFPPTAPCQFSFQRLYFRSD